MKNFKAGNSISLWTKFLFCLAKFYMRHKGYGKAAKVVNFVAKWLNLYPFTVLKPFFIRKKEKAGKDELDAFGDIVVTLYDSFA